MTEVSAASISHHNQQALAELCRLVRFSQGEFALILAVCNVTRQRQQLVELLQQQCPVPLTDVPLSPTASTLFSSLNQHLQRTAGSSPPAALMVYGLDGVQDVAQVLTATNQIREEFRRWDFPLVLWLTDVSLKHLIRRAPDFYTWGTPITFETPATVFQAFLEDLIADVWQQVLRSRENHFLSHQDLGFTPGSTRSQELEASLAALNAEAIALSPTQMADLAFVQGRVGDNNNDTAREHYERSLAQWQALLAQHGAIAAPRWLEKQGHVQFYLGLWWRNHAERHQQVFAQACQRACRYFQQTVETLKQAQRLDLVAKYMNYWAESLHRLHRWTDLEIVATQALTLHQQYQNPFRTARAYGFLAEVAVARSDWTTAQRQAEAALAQIQPLAVAQALSTTAHQDPEHLGQPTNGNPHTTTDQTPTALSDDDIDFFAWVNSFHRSWYLFSLGTAQFHQGHIDAAVTTLEQARRITQPEYDPALYSSLLEQLRQGYFHQGKYLQAFETRRHKDAIESRFNYRAFVGAGRLQPKQQITNPALPAEAETKDLIMSSGRRQDVQRLFQRLAQDEYVLTVIYGPSGVGKSSLLEAGLVPALEAARFEGRRVVPVYLRRYRDWAGDLEAALTVTEESVASRLASTSSIVKDTSLTDPADPAVGVLTRLRQQTKRHRVVVLLFDQFEEFFFEFEQPANRRPFYYLLRDCLALPFVKVVLSLREDYIHHLLECDRLTDLAIIDNNILDKKWLYYLGNFSPTDTKAVITDLTDPTPYSPDPALVDQVVADLAAGAGEVRPIELQIVGAQLQAEGLTTCQTYRAWGDPHLPTKELLVQKYLKDIVQECGPLANQRIAEIVLYLLTDEKGTRPLKTASDLAEDLCSMTSRTPLDCEALALVLQILTESGLVMEIPEAPEDRYQLVHDYLAAFLRAAQQPLMAQLEEERRQRAVTERRQLRQARRAAIIFGLLAIAASMSSLVAWASRAS